MNIRKSFVVEVILIVIQLSFIKTINVHHDSIYSLIYNSSSFDERIVASRVNSDVTKKSRSTIVNDSLAASDTNPIIPNSKRLKRQTRKNAPPESHETQWENKLEKIKKEIEELKNSPDVYKIMEERINKLEANVGTLESDSLNLFSDQKGRIQLYQSFINTYNQTIADFVKEKNEIKHQLNTRHPLRKMIIQNIVDHDFDNALKNLRNLTGDLQENMNIIIHDIYINPAGHFKPILRFGNIKNMNITTRLAVYEALKSEMGNNNSNAIANSLQVIKSLDRAIKEPELDPDNKSEAENVKREFQAIVIDKISFELKDAVYANNFRTVSEIFNEIDRYYPELFQDIIKEVVHNIMDRIDIEKLVDFFDTLEHSAQSVFGFSAVFNALKRRRSLDHEAIVAIAFGLKNITNKNFSNEKSRKEAHNLYGAFPESVYSLIFPVPLCIKNVKYNEYLFADSAKFKNNNNNRMVFTHSPKTRNEMKTWYVDKKINENKYLIKNIFYNNETLWADKKEDSNGYNRRVFTLNSAESDDSSLWTFVPSGNNVYIKNSFYNEYLYAFKDSSSTFAGKRHLYTSKKKDESKAGLWAIYICESIYISNE